MRISYWSSDVCSSDLLDLVDEIHVTLAVRLERIDQTAEREDVMRLLDRNAAVAAVCGDQRIGRVLFLGERDHVALDRQFGVIDVDDELDRKSTRLNSSH